MRQIWHRRVVAKWIARRENIQVVTSDAAQQRWKAHGDFITLTLADCAHAGKDFSKTLRSPYSRISIQFTKVFDRAIGQHRFNARDVMHHIAV